ncbi:MAG: LysE family translocator [Microbacterium sp.]|nr:LysE family translocator [Microbacterium sp.]
MPWSAVLAFSAAALALIVIPGPSVLFTIGRALALGRVAGIVSVAGNTVGSFVLATAVALGVGALIGASEIAFNVIKLAGAGYLVLLGVQTIVLRKRMAAATLDGERQSLWGVFGQACVVGVTNPKTLAFFVAVLPQFASASAGWPMPLQLELFGVIFCVIAFASDSVWAFLAAGARAWFGRSPKRLEALTATGGAMMIGLGGVLAFARRGA